MKSLIGYVLLALLAILAAMLLKVGQGQVVLEVPHAVQVPFISFLVPPRRIDVSFGFFLVIALLTLCFTFWLGRALQRLMAFPERVRMYRERRSELGAHRALYEALRALLEGRFVRAERAAQDAQKASEVAGMAALIGARAAHRLQAYERRDTWLEQAESDRDLATARRVVSAELWAEQREPTRALRAIDALQSSGARHLHAMRIALSAHVQAGHWREVMRTVRALEKRHALRSEAAARVRRLAVRGLLADASDDPDHLVSAWEEVDSSDRLVPEIALDAARRLNFAGRGAEAAAALQAVLERKWDERLLAEYARCEDPGSRATIEKAEAWLKDHPRSQPLLQCLARICLREKLWGKARAYLEECQRLGEDAQTSLALAELAEAMGDGEGAARHFRKAAIGLAAQRPPEEAPPRAPRTIRREATW
jgi:HemY protein